MNSLKHKSVLLAALLIGGATFAHSHIAMAKEVVVVVDDDDDDDDEDYEVKKVKKPSRVKKQGNVGIGVAFGTDAWPISFKVFVDDNFSIQLTGPLWGIWWGFGLGASPDFLYEGDVFYQNNSLELSWQLGAGGDFFWYQYSYDWYYNGGKYSTYILGGHLNVGFQVLLRKIPLDFVFEFRPGFYVTQWNHSYTSSDLKTLESGRWHATQNILSVVAHVRWYF